MCSKGKQTSVRIAGATGSTGREIVTPGLAPRYALCYILSALRIPVSLWTVVFTRLHAGDARHCLSVAPGGTGRTF